MESEILEVINAIYLESIIPHLPPLTRYKIWNILRKMR